MISIDAVYQRVLALANKEQRGYITPQEFNLLANHAQLEIIDQYFYDLNQFSRGRGNSTDFSDMVDLIEEKIGFLTLQTTITGGNPFALPGDLYHLGNVTNMTAPVERITLAEWQELIYSPLTTPTIQRPVYWFNQINATSTGEITIHPPQSSIQITYVKTPTPVNWGYVVVDEKAMYDPNITNNFDLHPMEETELVYKILKLSGITIRQQDIVQAAQGLESVKNQQEKI